MQLILVGFAFCGGTLFLFTGNDASCSSGKGHIASGATPGDEVNVCICVIPSAVIPNNIQPWYWIVVFVDGVHVLVDSDAVHRGEEERAGAYTVIWRLPEFR